MILLENLIFGMKKLIFLTNFTFFEVVLKIKKIKPANIVLSWWLLMFIVDSHKQKGQNQRLISLLWVF